MYETRRVFSASRRKYGVRIALPTGGSVTLIPTAGVVLPVLWLVRINQSYPVGVPKAWQQFTVRGTAPCHLYVVNCVLGLQHEEVGYPIEPPNWAELIAMIPWIMKHRYGEPAIDWLSDHAPYPFEEVLRVSTVWSPDPGRIQPVGPVDAVSVNRDRVNRLLDDRRVGDIHSTVFSCTTGGGRRVIRKVIQGDPN